MVLTLYYYNFSAPARSSLVTIKALGLENEVEFREVDLMKGEQMDPDFLKINPLHTIPALTDNNFKLFDSHAINIYLVEKYGKNDYFYPKDIHKRALVDQMLFYNDGSLMQKWAKVVLPIFQGSKTISNEAKDGILEAYSYLNTILKTRRFLAGDNITLADFHLGCWMLTMDLIIKIEKERFSKLYDWLVELKNLSYFDEANTVGLSMLQEFFASKLNL